MKSDPGQSGRRKSGLAGPLGLGVVVVWLVLTLVALGSLLSGPSPWSGAREGLVPEAQRSPRDRAWVLVRVDFDALAKLEPGVDLGVLSELGADTDPRTILAQAGFAIEEAFGPAREPLAPPKTEITRWLDAHALYLLPVDTHAALAERLSDEQVRSEVQGLRARLSSPLFSVSGDQPRRDPLGIQALAAGEAGRLGHVAEVPGSQAPQVSANGDLLAASGDRVLIALRADQPVATLETAVDTALEGLPVQASLIDLRADDARVAAQLEAQWMRLALGCLAAVVLLLSVVMRRVVPVLALGLCASSVWVIFVWLVTGLDLAAQVGFELAGLDLASLALSFVALAVGCDAALRLPKISARGWVAPVVASLALVPLLLAPYPLWRCWALLWLVAQVLMTGVMKLVFPVLLRLSRGDFEWRQPGFRLTPVAWLSLLVCVVLGAAGAAVHPKRDYRSLARVPILDALTQAQERELITHFFDPSMIVEARSGPGEDESESPPAAAALDAAADTSTRLASLVPGLARRIDSPGSFVIPLAELETRKQALATLDLDVRMDVLSTQLEDQGLRAEAFAEFVRGAADIDELPSAQAALDGPLGPWIRGYLIGEGDATELRTRVELRGREGLMTQALSEEQLAELPVLRGPAIAAMHDRREANSRLVACVAGGLWLTALLIWLGTSQLSTALGVTVVAATSQLGLAFALHLLDQVRSPHTLPVILIVGVTAALAGARACEAVRHGRPIVARGVLLAGGCQVAVGLILLGSSQPLWRELGLSLALGSAVASGLGLFVTPGLARVFGRVDRRPDPSSDSRGTGKPS